VARGLLQAGVDGCFYWYDNNWHYIRNWDHLKKLRSAARLPLALLPLYPDYEKVRLPRSDSIMKRTISILIKISWTQTELVHRIERIVNGLKAQGLS